MQPALLVIDVQKSFFGPETTQSLDSAIGTINAAIALFRANELPLICIQHIDENDGLVPGDEKFDLPASLNILPTDFHIHKHYQNSFNKTDLESKLRELGVDTVIVSGYCAEYCVLSTYRGARDLDLTSILLRDGIASSIPANILFVESINDIVSFGALAKLLEPITVKA